MADPFAHHPDDAEGGVPLARKVAFLRTPEAYAERPAHVDVVETHMSWVFLTDRYAHKLRKPVRSAVLDFSTIDARKADCEAEVRLNRRLAPQVYLGVVPLVVDEAGRLALGGAGRTVDWLVRMVRLATWRRLDQAIQANGVRGADVLRLGQALTRFYAGAPPLATDPESYRNGFAVEIETNLREIASRAPPLAGLAETAAAAQRAALATLGDLLRERARQGRIVEAHGDLRPEHIFLDGEPAIIDCLEFNRALRLLDPVDELAFLALECERLGAPWIGDVIFHVYGAGTGDAPPPRLADFYRSFRASLRARLAARRLDEADGRRPQWLERTRGYLALAVRHGERLHPAGPDPPAAG